MHKQAQTQAEQAFAAQSNVCKIILDAKRKLQRKLTNIDDVSIIKKRAVRKISKADRIAAHVEAIQDYENNLKHFRAGRVTPRRGELQANVKALEQHYKALARYMPTNAAQ